MSRSFERIRNAVDEVSKIEGQLKFLRDMQSYLSTESYENVHINVDGIQYQIENKHKPYIREVLGLVMKQKEEEKRKHVAYVLKMRS